MQDSSSRLGTSLLTIALLAIVAVATMIFGAHFNLWQPIVGFGLIRNYLNPIAYSVLGLGIGALIYQAKIRSTTGLVKIMVSVMIAIIMLAPTINTLINKPKRAAPIHDITTNTIDPPAFIFLDDSRAGARNSLVYGGAKVADIQNKAYPDIKPIISNTPAIELFAQAIRVANSMGWDIVVQDLATLRFEATAHTTFFKFADDIVVVVSSDSGSNRVDIRSVSRIGRGDRGANAARIRAFINAFNS